jgi:uncharacterized protein (TIRG00374 family)
MNGSRRSTWTWPARVLVCVGLLSWLFARADVKNLARTLQHTFVHGQWWLAALGFTFLGLLAGVVRWRLILEAQGIRVGLARVFRVFFIGQFFNSFMLGACGGDVVRAFCITRDAPDRRAEAASTVFVDRAIGLFVTIAIACALIAPRMRLFFSRPETRCTGALMFLFLGGSIVGLFALFRRNLFEHLSLFQRVERNPRFGALIRRTYDAFYLYRGHPRALAFSSLLSAGNLAFLTLACYSLGRSLGIARPFVDYLTFFPVITVIAAVPVTPGSLGVRESLFVELFELVEVGVHASMLLSLMVYASSLAWSLFGGVLYLLAPPAEHARVREIRRGT